MMERATIVLERRGSASFSASSGMEHRIDNGQHRTKTVLGDGERETYLTHMFLFFSPYCQGKSFVSAML